VDDNGMIDILMNEYSQYGYTTRDYTLCGNTVDAPRNSTVRTCSACAGDYEDPDRTAGCPATPDGPIEEGADTRIGSPDGGLQ
jgi:hypothetical protein